MVAITQVIAGLMTVVAVQALPQPQNAAPAPAPPATPGNPDLFRDLFSAPTAIKRFQRLLVSGESLITGDALKKLVVFDFNGATPAAGAKGGATLSAVSFNIPSSVCYVLIPDRTSSPSPS